MAHMFQLEALEKKALLGESWKRKEVCLPPQIVNIQLSKLNDNIEAQAGRLVKRQHFR